MQEPKRDELILCDAFEGQRACVVSHDSAAYSRPDRPVDAV